MSGLSYAINAIRKRGVRFLWTYFVESIWFDLRHGTRTFARVPKDEQAIDENGTEADEGLLYVASFTSVTKKTVSAAKELLGADRFQKAQFLDLGCGKGKALLVFAKFFGQSQAKPAIGIEYDPELAALADRNISKCLFARGRVKVMADSAVNLRDHVTADTLVVYLYNSFQGETLRAVLDVLRDIPHVLIYVDPAEKAVLSEYAYTIDHENHGRYNADTWLVARSGI